MTVVGPDVDTIEQLDLETSDKEPNAVVHIINPARNRHAQPHYMSAQEIVDYARAHGIELNALCGAKFVPTKEPGDLDMCKACIDIAGDIMREEG